MLLPVRHLTMPVIAGRPNPSHTVSHTVDCAAPGLPPMAHSILDTPL